MKKLIFGLYALTLVSIFVSCKGEPKQVTAIEGTNVITAEGKKEAIEGAGAADATTFYIISQSQKVQDADDAARSAKFTNFIKGINLEKICYTASNKTEVATAEAVSAAKGCHNEGFTPGALEAFTEFNLVECKGKSLAVVTHGELTPKMLNLITGTKDYAVSTDDGFDHLFVVSAKAKGKATVTEYKL